MCKQKDRDYIYSPAQLKKNKSEYNRLKLHAVIHMYKTYETHAKLQYLYNGEEIHFVLKKNQTLNCFTKEFLNTNQ